MTHGGARNRSGPKPTEDSGRSDRRGFKLTALPSEGFKGEAPEFPLPGASRRELEVWTQAWTTPQACAWSMPSERWRLRSVAMWVRTSVRAEAPDVAPPLLSQLHRFADQIGLTTAGLAEMGWKVAVDEVSQKATEKSTAKPVRKSSRDRLKVVGSGD